MEAYFNFLNQLVSKCRLEFSVYPELKWINMQTASIAQETKNRLLDGLETNFLFKNTKLYHNQISKGCQFCGLGVWSCLFITGKCNASCFYCPTQQDVDDIPSSQGLLFQTPESYAEYINHFNFKAVAFSGGEPLLVAERVLHYLKRLRKVCPSDIYTWMYTNGILGTETIYRRLAALDLNEIRFDIGATAYSLEKVKLAKGIIKNITVEIPVIPEEKERLKALLPEMEKMGITNLNLHQLRLTHYNADQLKNRDYTYIPAEKPIVLESELAALEIIRYAREKKYKLGINYCSFFFKNRFQAAGVRKQIANCLAKPNDIITRKGFIRNINEEGISYETIRLVNANGAFTNEESLKLKFKTYAYRRTTEMDKVFADASLKSKIETYIKQASEDIPKDSDLFDVWKFEYIEKDLRDY